MKHTKQETIAQIARVEELNSRRLTIINDFEATLGDIRDSKLAGLLQNLIDELIISTAEAFGISDDDLFGGFTTSRAVGRR